MHYGELFQVVNVGFMMLNVYPMKYVVIPNIVNPQPPSKGNQYVRYIYGFHHLIYDNISRLAHGIRNSWAPPTDKAGCETWKDLLDLGPNGLKNSSSCSPAFRNWRCKRKFLNRPNHQGL